MIRDGSNLFEKMQSPDFCISLIKVVTRASNSPLSFAPAINNPISKDIIRFDCGQNNETDQICKIYSILTRHINILTMTSVQYNHPLRSSPREKRELLPVQYELLVLRQLQFCQPHFHQEE